MTRGEAEEMIARFLMETVRADHYPSTTQMSMLEQIMPREMLPDYLDILFEKVAEDNVPSIPMLRRIQRLAEALPIRE